MSSIGIVTDSTAYLPSSFKEQFEIEVVSLTINFEDGSFPEAELGNDFVQFYEKIQRSSFLPTTSMPSVGDFIEVYEKIAKRVDKIISIHIAESLSSTVKAARVAAQMLPGLDIQVIDSKTTAIGLYMIIEAAVRAIASGMGKDVLQIIQHIIDGMSFFVMPETLEYMHRGGRVSAVGAMLGNLLQIKPILYFNKARNNVVEVLEKVRTQEKGLQRILEEMKKQGPNIRVYAGHVGAEAQGRALVERIQSIFPGLTPELLQVGPVVGAHSGPGTLGLVFYPLTPSLKKLFAL
ncbi:MAG: DegV family protein [Thermacetogeniaceae bacterium]